MTKPKQKISGCLRTLTGARQFCAIRSYLSTAAKHDLGFFDALVLLTEGRAWTPAAALNPANAAPDQLHFVLYVIFSLMPSNRRQVYRLLSREHGSYLVSLWASVTMLIVFTVYTWLTALMVNQFHWFSFSGVHGVVRSARIADFYLWHLANAVPVLNLPDTFHWSPPLTYTSFLAGILVFAFMLNVAAAFIAIPAEWVRYRREQSDRARQAKSNSPSPNVSGDQRELSSAD